MLPMEPRTPLVASPESDATRLGTDAGTRRNPARALFSASVLAALAVTFAACSSNSTASTTDSSIHQSGTGSKTISSVDLPKKWSVTWKFNCTNPISARRFVLSASNGGGSPIGITDQTGLGGGGTKVYSRTGTFDFTITTSCTWNLSVGPPSSSSATTSTTAR